MKKIYLLFCLLASLVTSVQATNFALSFDGFDDVVEVLNNGNSLSLSQMTVEAWVNPNAGSARGNVVYKNSNRNGNNDNYNLTAGGNTGTSFHVEESAGDVDFSAVAVNPAPDNTWTHLAGVFTGSQLKLYVNGVLDVTVNTGNVNLYQGTENLFLGTDRFSNHGGLPVGQAPRQSYDGLMDEVRIWNIVRTDQEIADNFDDVVDVNSVGLVGYWNFDESINDQNVLDISGNGNNGILGISLNGEGDDPNRVLSTAPFSDNAVPEPSSVFLVLMAGMAFLARRKD